MFLPGVAVDVSCLYSITVHVITDVLLAGVHTFGIQRRVRTVHLRRIRPVLCVVPVRSGGTRVHERVLGREGQRNGGPQSFLPLDRMRQRRMV